MGQDNGSLDDLIFGEAMTEQNALVAVRDLLTFIGEDPNRDGLKDTPGRVVRAWAELTSGYRDDPKQILSRTFDEKSDEMVILNNIQFYSTCEHHMLPFMGTACVAYMPTDKVIGISKLARLVNCFARRLQVQERMTREIANAIQEHLAPAGVGVVIKAHHLCMGCRGVRQHNSVLTTSSLLGKFMDPTVRAEFMQLMKG